MPGPSKATLMVEPVKFVEKRLTPRSTTFGGTSIDAVILYVPTGKNISRAAEVPSKTWPPAAIAETIAAVSSAAPSPRAPYRFTL